jgi:integrase
MTEAELTSFAQSLSQGDAVEVVVVGGARFFGTVRSVKRRRAAVDYDTGGGNIVEGFIPSDDVVIISAVRLPPPPAPPTISVGNARVINNPYARPAPIQRDVTPSLAPTFRVGSAAPLRWSQEDRPLVEFRAPEPHAAAPPPPPVPDEWEDLEYLQGELLATNVPLPGGDPRRVGQPIHVADLKGRDVVGMSVTDAGTPHLARLGVAKSTAQAHRRCLRQLSQMPETFRDLPLGTALVEWHTHLRQERKWQWTTTVTRMATLHGALRLLPIYTPSPHAILLKQDATWTMAMRAAGQKARQQTPNQPKAATSEQVRRSVELCPQEGVQNALRLSWLTAGRGGDVLLLRPENVTVQGQALHVNFVRGKTAKVRGPYTVHTTLPANEFLSFLAAAKAARQTWLFPGVKGSQLKDALRMVDPALEQRSLRRGAIQALAATGMTDEELLHYSGHSSVHMLRRYLNYGLKSGEAARRAERAAVLHL